MYLTTYNKIYEAKTVKTKGEIVGDMKISLSTEGSITIQQINKDIEDVNNIINQPDLRDVYGMFYPTKAIYTHLFQVQMEHSSV